MPWGQGTDAVIDIRNGVKTLKPKELVLRPIGSWVNEYKWVLLTVPEVSLDGPRWGSVLRFVES